MRSTDFSAVTKPSDWISDEGTPDPTPLPRVLHYQILIRPVSVVRKTKGNILIPDSVADTVERLSTVGRVLAVGPSCFSDSAFKDERGVVAGDYVAYNKFAGTKVTYKGVKLIVLRDNDLIMVTDDPKFIDPNYVLGA